MSERYEDLGGQESDYPLPQMDLSRRHDGSCEHPDGHCCPISNDLMIDTWGYESVKPCECTGRFD